MMVAHDIRAALARVPELVITEHTTDREAFESIAELGRLNQCLVGVTRFRGLTPWERHPDGDELLHVLEGEVDVTVLTDGGPVEARIAAGSVFVVPRGLWHRQLPRPRVTLLFATPADTSEISFANDPRRQD
jgi:mannose-6-phosphate isomerase-like protein (cupin superfamily)